MLVRRLRDACASPRPPVRRHLSAPWPAAAPSPTSRPTVAEVATRLFGAEVTPERVIGETLVRATTATAEPDAEPAAQSRAVAADAHRPTTTARRPTRWRPGSRRPSGLTSSEDDRPARPAASRPRSPRPPRDAGRADRRAPSTTAPRRSGARCWPARAASDPTPAGRCSRSGCTSSSPRATRSTSPSSREDRRHITGAYQVARARAARQGCCSAGFCRECGQEYLVVAKASTGAGETRSRRAATATPAAATRSTATSTSRSDQPWPARPAGRWTGLPESWLTTDPATERRCRQQAQVPAAPRSVSTPDGTEVAGRRARRPRSSRPRSRSACAAGSPTSRSAATTSASWPRSTPRAAAQRGHACSAQPSSAPDAHRPETSCPRTRASC